MNCAAFFLACGSVLLILPAAAQDSALAPIQPLSAEEYQRLLDTERTVYLEVTLNGQVLPDVLPFTLKQGHVWASAQVMKAMYFASPLKHPKGDTQLTAWPEIEVQFVSQQQKLIITAPLRLLVLPETQLQVVLPPPPPANPPLNGVLLNYDSFAQSSENQQNSSIFTELRFFGSFGTLRQTGVSRFTSEPSSAPPAYQRLETTYEKSWLGSGLTLRMGDITSSSNIAWARATYLGGIQFGSDFALTPLSNRPPLPRFSGSATTPSQVELWLNGIRRYQELVPLGSFAIYNPYFAGQTGHAQIKVIDILGRETITDVYLQPSTQLLAPGLKDWSVALGVLRQNNSAGEAQYGQNGVVIGHFRQGVNHVFTGELSGQASPNFFLLGAGAVFSLTNFGNVYGSLAHSQHGATSLAPARQGQQATLGYQAQYKTLTFGITHQHNSQGYTDVAALETGNAQEQRLFNSYLSWSLNNWGQLGWSYIQRQEASTSLTNSSHTSVFSWSRSLGRYFNVSISAIRGSAEIQNEDIVQFSVQIPMGKQVSSSASLRYSSKGESSANLGLQGSLANERIKWQLQGNTTAHSATEQTQPSSSSSYYAGLRYQATHANLSANVRQEQKHTTYQLGASGSLIAVGTGSRIAWFAPREIGDAFAVVVTGVPDQTILLERNPAARTNDEGYALVTPLASYSRNQIGLDPQNLPLNYKSTSWYQNLTPPRFGGSLARFDVHAVRAATIILKALPNKTSPEVGTAVYLNGSTRASGWVGFDNRIYLENLKDDNVLRIGTNPECVLRFSLLSSLNDQIPEIELALCP